MTSLERLAENEAAIARLERRVAVQQAGIDELRRIQVGLRELIDLRLPLPSARRARAGERKAAAHA